MADNIFDRDDYNKILGRIKGLTEFSQRKWGTMNINQMLQHCAVQLQLALGLSSQSDFEGPSIMRTGFGRWLILYIIPWSKGLPTPSKMNPINSRVSHIDLESDKKSLLELLDQVYKHRDLHPHPFFGELNEKDWGRLIWKHLDHHLKQFEG